MASERAGIVRIIALEEHFATPGTFEGPGREFVDHLASSTSQTFPASPSQLVERLYDLSDGRIAAMDAAGVDVQVLSLTSPGLEQLRAPDAIAAAREVNDQLARAIQRHPERFAGFAALPTADPVAAADELQRAVREYRFVGAIINGHCQGRRLDDEFFWPILQRAEELGAPLYLHPTPPPASVFEPLYAGNYPASVAFLLSTAAWGWHIETATHLLRLILSGAFDRFPRLQVIIGHMGEALPAMLPRLDVVLTAAATNLNYPMSHYLRHNVYYTFAGFNWTPQFLALLLQVGVDRIMFATDYPYSPMPEATAFLAGIPVSPQDRAQIAHGNAEQLLGL
ncbi:amidohydrolase family protein [Mycobacterium angelicum]|uniref:amidohydrolase family protein n=1 Tax=Mycobacterium angelicum TaxID=470074 RepID=UPI001FE87D04|nr:amidohydrolase family protein [Mycobacterium angelicum]